MKNNPPNNDFSDRQLDQIVGIFGRPQFLYFQSLVRLLKAKPDER